MLCSDFNLILIHFDFFLIYRKLQIVEVQVKDTLDTLREGIEKIMDRGNKLVELEERTDAMNEDARSFKQQSIQLERQKFWENRKILIIMGVISAIVILIIIISCVC